MKKQATHELKRTRMSKKLEAQRMARGIKTCQEIIESLKRIEAHFRFLAGYNNWKNKQGQETKLEKPVR